MMKRLGFILMVGFVVMGRVCHADAPQPRPEGATKTCQSCAAQGESLWWAPAHMPFSHAFLVKGCAGRGFAARDAIY